jgi:hypothetical protein
MTSPAAGLAMRPCGPTPWTGSPPPSSTAPPPSGAPHAVHGTGLPRAGASPDITRSAQEGRAGVKGAERAKPLYLRNWCCMIKYGSNI